MHASPFDMHRFTADWLTEREPADAAARSARLARLAAERLGGGPLQAIDLASGTGSNVRYLIPFLAARQHWQLLDGDPDLVAEVPRQLERWSVTHGYTLQRREDHLELASAARRCRVITRTVDLGAPDTGLFDGATFVTASALLDLVSRMWLDRVTAACARTGAVVLFALTYDGRIQCFPEDTEDAAIAEAVNRHQRSDKGFGRALGPDAVATVTRCLDSAGYAILNERTDWTLGPDQDRLQRMLIEGWADAAAAIRPERRQAIAAWRRRRLAHVEARRSRLVVGHEDLAGWPIR